MDKFFSLKILDLFKGIFNKIGVEYDDLRLIVQHKLIMDKRKQSNLFSMNRKNGEKKNITNVFTLLIGFFLSSTVFSINSDFKTRMTVITGIIMFMIFILFISEFSTTLLNNQDKGILFTKGVTLRTVNTAKVVHAIIHLVITTISLGGFSVIAVGVMYGPVAAVLILVSFIFIDTLMLIFTNFIYAFILKVYNGEKLKDVLTRLQIVLSSIFFLVYFGICMLPNLALGLEEKITIGEGLWQLLVPPAWYGNFMDLAIGGKVTMLTMMSTIFAICIPIAALVIYIRISNELEENLEKLNANVIEKEVKEKSKFEISDLVCKGRLERIFFKFSNIMITSEREFKMKIMPMLVMGIGIVIMYLFLFSSGMGISEVLKNRYALLTLYALGLSLSQIVYLISFSQYGKAAWIYLVAPIEEPGELYKAGIKAMAIKFIAPIMLGFSLIFIVFQGIVAIPYLILILLNIILNTIILFAARKKILPFSREFNQMKDAEEYKIMFINMGAILIGLALTGIGFLSMWITLILIVIVGVIDYLLFENLFKFGWEKIE